jgi:hypothetical protein
MLKKFAGNNLFLVVVVGFELLRPLHLLGHQQAHCYFIHITSSFSSVQVFRPSLTLLHRVSLGLRSSYLHLQLGLQVFTIIPSPASDFRDGHAT